MPPPIIEPYTLDHREALSRMLSEEGLLDENAPLRSIWLALIGAHPFRANLAVMVAREEGQILGVAAAGRRPFYRDLSRMVNFWVRSEKRRRGIGRTLMASVGKALRAEGIPRLLVGTSHRNETVPPFLHAIGFSHIETDWVMGAGETVPPVVPVAGVECRVYAGGDTCLNARIADLMNRCFLNEAIVPEATADMVAEILDDEDCWMLVALEEKSGQVVGYAEVTDWGFFGGFAISRRYWGKGLADWVLASALQHYATKSTQAAWTLVRPKNRASLAMMERFGCRQIGCCDFYGLPT